MAQIFADLGHFLARSPAFERNAIKPLLAQRAFSSPKGRKDKESAMQDNLQPIIHKTRLLGLKVNVAKSGLCMGDVAQIDWLPDGNIGLFAPVRRMRFGFLPTNGVGLVGHLDEDAADHVRAALAQGGTLRGRIVTLTPEYLGAEGGAAVYVSIWGNIAFIRE